MSRRVKAALKNYPLEVEMQGRALALRVMTVDDGPALLDFARNLPLHDLLFLRRNITEQHGIDKWIRDLRNGRIYSVVAEDEKGVAGYCTIHLNDLDWSQHVAELRVLIGERVRGIGLGRLLTREAFNMALALGIEKVVGRMTLDQKAARTVYEELGFRPEALLRDEVKDREGKRHDLLVMCCDVSTFMANRDAYGIPA